MVKTLDQLTAEAQTAAQRAAAARDAADQARAEEQARREERMHEWDREHPSTPYDRNDLERQVTAAQRALTAAIRSDPCWMAIVDLGIARLHLRDAWTDAGAPDTPPPTGKPIAFEQLARIADQTVHDRFYDGVAAERDARAQAREAAGDGRSG